MKTAPKRTKYWALRYASEEPAVLCLSIGELCERVQWIFAVEYAAVGHKIEIETVEMTAEEFAASVEVIS